MSQSRRILFLTKRQYMGRDLLDDRYGRWREMPIALKRLGHEVRGLCFSYESRKEGQVVDNAGDVQIEWTSMNLGAARLPGVVRYWQSVRREASQFDADLIFAASDMFHIVMGKRLARSVGAELLADLSDNYESYRAGVPGVRPAFRAAVRGADYVTCVSSTLARFVVDEYRTTASTEVVEMGVLGDIFQPGDRKVARKRLELPMERPIVVVAGALQRDREIELVFRAVDAMAYDEHPPFLVVAGHRDPGLDWPRVASYMDLGLLDHAEVPNLIRSADVVLVPVADTPFGRFCFPQKISEAIACQVPIVAAATPVLTDLMKEFEPALYQMGSLESVVAALRFQMKHRVINRAIMPSWKDLGKRVSRLIS